MSEEKMMDPQEALATLRAMAEEDDNNKAQADTTVPTEQVSEEPAEEPKSFIQRVRSGGVTGDDIPEALRADWVRSVLGGNPFSYGVPILGGRAVFVFSELDKDEAKFFRRMSRATEGDVATQVKLSILLYLKGIEGDIEQKITAGADLTSSPAPAYPVRDIEKAYDDLCDSLPQGLVRFLVGAWGIYSTLVGILTDDAFPDSF